MPWILGAFSLSIKFKIIKMGVAIANGRNNINSFVFKIFNLFCWHFLFQLRFVLLFCVVALVTKVRYISCGFQKFLLNNNQC